MNKFVIHNSSFVTRSMPLYVHQMDEAAARTIIGWRYEPPYDIYQIDPSPEELVEVVRFLLDPLYAYYRIDNEEGELVAFCCFGFDAQVPGGNYRIDAIDIGMGVRPDLTGKGQGVTYANATLAHARRLFAPSAFRVTVAGFNQRALRVWEKAGFSITQTFQAQHNGAEYVILMRDS